MSEFLPTFDFRNIGRTKSSTLLRFGVLGTNSAILRFSNVKFPYDDNIVHEIIISGWENKYTEARQQHRQNHKIVYEFPLKRNSTVNLMSNVNPLIFTVEFYNSGVVAITKDKESQPFFTFKDTNSTISWKFVGFANYYHPVTHFFDCPLNKNMN